MTAVVICANDFPNVVVLNPTPEKILAAKEALRAELDKRYGRSTAPTMESLEKPVYIREYPCTVIE